jgi:hypothetical protein
MNTDSIWTRIIIPKLLALLTIILGFALVALPIGVFVFGYDRLDVLGWIALVIVATIVWDLLGLGAWGYTLCERLRTKWFR